MIPLMVGFKSSFSSLISNEVKVDLVTSSKTWLCFSLSKLSEFRIRLLRINSFFSTLATDMLLEVVLVEGIVLEIDNKIMSFRKSYLKSGSKKIRHVQKLTIDKKSTFFVQSSWNLVKIIKSWVNNFNQV